VGSAAEPAFPYLPAQSAEHGLGLEDCRTGCVEIRDDGVYRRDDAVKTLMELARIRYEANQTEALLAADVEI
jgi:hypothetical protein